MALEITSVGATVKYCWETTSGSRPTSGYSTLPSVNSAPEFDLAANNIDCSDISDTVTRYVAGRQDMPQDAAFTLNHTEAVITAWDALVSVADTKKAAGLQLWWEYCFPGATNSFYFAGYPQQLGTGGISQNELDTIPAHVCPSQLGGWEAKSTT